MQLRVKFSMQVKHFNKLTLKLVGPVYTEIMVRRLYPPYSVFLLLFPKDIEKKDIKSMAIWLQNKTF